MLSFYAGGRNTVSKQVHDNQHCERVLSAITEQEMDHDAIIEGAVSIAIKVKAATMAFMMIFGCQGTSVYRVDSLAASAQFPVTVVFCAFDSSKGTMYHSCGKNAEDMQSLPQPTTADCIFKVTNTNLNGTSSGKKAAVESLAVMTSGDRSNSSDISPDVYIAKSSRIHKVDDCTNNMTMLDRPRKITRIETRIAITMIILLITFILLFPFLLIRCSREWLLTTRKGSGWWWSWWLLLSCSLLYYDPQHRGGVQG